MSDLDISADTLCPEPNSGHALDDLPFSGLLVSPDEQRLEAALELPTGFIDSLLAESDWSFVVKAHALIEATLTHLLVSTADPRLAQTYERLPLTGGPASKLGVLSALELLDGASIQFIKSFGALRNRLVHDVRQVGFSFESYAHTLDTSALNRAADPVRALVGLPDGVELREWYQKHAHGHLKEIFAIGVLAVVARTYLRAHPDEHEEAVRAARQSAPAIVFMVALLVALAASQAKSGGFISSTRKFKRLNGSGENRPAPERLGSG